MSLHRFFLDDQVIAVQPDDVFRLELSREDAKHARVIRLKSGEHIAVVDAEGDYFELEVQRIDDEGIFASISRHLDAPVEGFELILYQGLAKGERFETVLKHATELGVSAFVPLISDRCVVKLDAKRSASKLSRWETIIRNAAKQSGQIRIPKLFALEDIPTAVLSLSEMDLVLICWEEAMDSLNIRAAIDDAGLAQDARIAIIVGPEGGFSDDEVSKLLSSGSTAKLVSLGPTILRTETAGIVSCALALDRLREGLSG